MVDRMISTVVIKEAYRIPFLPARIIHMNTRKYVGGSIHTVNKSGQLCKYVIVRKAVRPDVETVGINPGNQKKYGHPYHTEIHQTAEFFFLTKKEIQSRSGDVYEPEQIRNDKNWYKWNMLIQRRTDDMQMLGPYVFKIAKNRQIKRKIQQQ